MAPLIPEDAPGWAIRLEAKLDIAIAQHGQAIESLSREIAELRSERQRDVERTETAVTTLADRSETAVTTLADRTALAVTTLDDRIDAHDRAHYITPRQLWAAVLGGAGVVAALSPLVERLYS